MSMALTTEMNDDTSLARNYAQTTTIQPATNVFRSLPIAVQREIERLTELLFFNRSAPPRRSVVLVDMDYTDGSSIWLATGIASVLCSALREAVYVLSLTPGEAGTHTVANQDADSDRNAPPNSLLIERIPEMGSHGGSTGALTDRLGTLQAQGHPVVVHLPHTEVHAGILARVNSIEGVVLLTRASRTRKAALEAIERRLTATGVPLLGSVLLDRVHPIPEKLYKLL